MDQAGRGNNGVRDDVITTETQRVKQLRRANEILKLASTFFAQAELTADQSIK